MLSARHSTNRLGEGLRQEPIVALAGHHLMRVSEWTENMGQRAQASQEKLGGAISPRVDAPRTDLESLAAGKWVRWMRWGTAPEPNSDYSPPTFWTHLFKLYHTSRSEQWILCFILLFSSVWLLLGLLSPAFQECLFPFSVCLFMWGPLGSWITRKR